MLTALQAPEEALDEQEKDFVEKIRKHGWFGTNVFAEDNQPGFSFSTGFWVTLDCPEIITFGLKAENAHSILWSMFLHFKEGRPLHPGTRITTVVDDYDVYLFPVDKEHYAEYLGWSRWFYAGDTFPCLQLVWPDRDNRFPWEAGSDSGMAKLQPDITAEGWAGLLR